VSSGRVLAGKESTTNTTCALNRKLNKINDDSITKLAFILRVVYIKNKGNTKKVVVKMAKQLYLCRK